MQGVISNTSILINFDNNQEIEIVLKALKPFLNNLTDLRNEIGINDIVVKTLYKEMKELDDDSIEPIEAYIRIGDIRKKFKLYYNKEENVYFGYSRDLEFEEIPYCRLLSYKEYIKRKNNPNYDLQPQSILYSYGYKLTNTTEEYRHKVLQFVIDNNIMKWGEIINFLEWLINLRNKDQECVELWNNDIDWVRGYIGTREVEVKMYE